VNACGNCGKDNPDEAAFCMACGGQLHTPPAVREARKTVTVVFCDVSRSTALGERLDPEALRRVMARYFDAMREALERHGGTVEKFIGDAVMAVFGIPLIHEDDALRAVRAAADMREAVARLSQELERDHGIIFSCRIGVNTGEVVAGDPASGQMLVTGDAVNVAARLEQAAEPGEVLIGGATHQLVRDSVVCEPLAPLSLKGKSGGVQAFRLLRVTDTFAARPRRMDSPMVGRGRELDALRTAFDRSVSDRACQLFTILAPAGTGKSRLVEEFLRGVKDVEVLRGRCLPYGEGITYFPILEIVKQASGLADFDVPEVVEEKVCRVLDGDEHQGVVCSRVSQLLGVAELGSPEETFWAVRRFIESVARQGPLVVILDDVHWAEPTLLDLVEHIADWSRDVPLLLACMARQELLDVRPAWGGGKLNATTISLEPLSEDESIELIANLVEAAEVPSEVGERVASAAEGNPLFVEEMLAMLVDEGLLTRDGARWTPRSDLSTVAVPPTISALLAARLDRLSADERLVLEASSVVGKEFSLGAVRGLVPEEMASSVPGHLMALVRRELIRPDRSKQPGGDAFRFRHLLIRDAAYDAISKELRAQLHERTAEWLERVAGERIAEQQEIVGYHLEQAYHLRTELNPSDPVAPELAEHAGVAFASSGQRAYARGDMPAAANLLERAAGLLPTTHATRLELLPNLAFALRERGREKNGFDMLQASLEIVDGVSDERTRMRLLLAREDLAPLEQWSEEAMERVALEAVEVFERASDEAGLATAWRTLGDVEWGRGRVESASAAWERAARHARHVGDRAGEAGDLGWMLTAALFGSVPVSEALEQAHETLSLVADVPAAKSWVLWEIASLKAMMGGFVEAHDLAREAWRIERDLGRDVTATHYGTQVEELTLRLEGDLEARARVLRQGLERYREVSGELNPLLAAHLAEALADLGLDDEAWIMAEAAREESGDFLHVRVHALKAQAIVLAHRGKNGEAERLAREAVDASRSTGFMWQTADALMTLGEVQRLIGARSEAEVSIREAIAIYEAKGIVPFAEEARSRLARIQDV